MFTFHYILGIIDLAIYVYILSKPSFTYKSDKLMQADILFSA